MIAFVHTDNLWSHKLCLLLRYIFTISLFLKHMNKCSRNLLFKFTLYRFLRNNHFLFFRLTFVHNVSHIKSTPISQPVIQNKHLLDSAHIIADMAESLILHLEKLFTIHLYSQLITNHKKPKHTL